MAWFTRRQLITGCSVVYLTIVTVIAAFALHISATYSLPIPNALSALTVALPPLAGIALESIISLQSELVVRGELHSSKIFQAVNVAFLVYETVLATLAGTHIAPVGDLLCPLENKWLDLFGRKDARAVRRIQDAFDCCGFRTPKDKAFPFSNDHATLCMERYDRSTACLDPWRATEQRVAIMMLVVPLAVFVWKAALFLAPGYDTSWLPSAIRLPGEIGPSSNGRPRPAITYRDAEGDSVREEVNRLNTDSNLATHIEGGRVRPSPLIEETENNMWSRG